MINNESITMTSAIALALDEICQKLMYSVVEKDGQKVVVDRELPFRLRYRLSRNRTLLSKDVELFNKRKALLFAQYGEPTEDGENVTITNEENLEKYKQAMSDLLDKEVTHTFFTLAPEDLDLVKDSDILISPEAMSVFVAYMTDDQEIRESFRTVVNIVPPKEETKAEEVKEEPKVEEVSKEEPKEEIVEPKKKTASTAPKKPRAPRKKKTVEAKVEDK